MDGGVVGRDGQSASAIENDWGSVASVLQRKMRDGSYEFTSYREILLSKGAKSYPRVVSVPTARDRIALKTIAGILAQLFPNSKTPMAQIRVGEVIDALKSKKFESFVRIDVRNFYPSIPHRAIFSQVRLRVRKKQFIDLLHRAISTPTVSMKAGRPNYSNLVGVPQGLSISNSLAEIAMSDIDLSFGAHKSAKYFRYVDDILVLCAHSEMQEIFETIRQKCMDLGLQVHEIQAGSKSQIGNLSSGFEYLGYCFTPAGVSVREVSVRKLEATIVHLFTAYKYQMKSSSAAGWADKAQESLKRRLDLVIAGCVFENIPRGWLHYFSQLDDVSLLSRLDAYVNAMVDRFGLPSSFKPKSFVRAYWHILRPNSSTRRYIPDFGKFNDVDRRAFLSALFPHQNFSSIGQPELDKRFNAEVRRLVSNLEKDISETS